MSGIYIHIPFCKKACHYCNFHFSTNLKTMDALLSAISNEITLRKNYLHDTVHTIYWGGGTPSILPAAVIHTMLHQIRSQFTVAPDAEITLESNPDDITTENLQQWKQAGVNRLSIGIQSFFEEDLAWMNRAHNATQAKAAIELAQAAGFDNITIDFIYGGPTLSDEHWKQNVQTAIALGIPHLSCYALTVEPKTALEKMIAQHKKEDVDTDKQSRHFDQLVQWVTAAGFEHYEISNFARPGYRSKHNSNYWAGTHYLGVGPSAHSFNGISRQWNIANNTLYTQSLEKGEVPFEVEYLTTKQQLNEYIMTSLRTMEGLHLKKIQEIQPGLAGEKTVEQLKKGAAKYIQQGLMLQQEDTLIITNAGKFLADGIAADLFC
ncbi:oxygen-independent coproporphyrinogen-3 oxidase [Filimonas lacunae]|uniref:Heme chaperone HemW n=1 Tax=Filimonas lacunae TaxID=477680 RepID=A0A173MSA5_9BACT|nr:radical SAM family heme chaperone HemW [Filimonas lacunae]BAV10258.1 oxygen-independent coproporphyrinogen III oxidase [Filimonas lacunae]SIT17753.1 oxygen-independent coproporphyrinogen-3 oxidase [Filimonas lacunae]